MDTNRSSLSVLIACALGALIGTLVAKQFAYNIWIGMMLGGMAGYVSLDPLAIVRAIPAAWRATKQWRPDWGLVWFRLRIITYATLAVVGCIAVFAAVCYLDYGNGKMFKQVFGAGTYTDSARLFILMAFAFSALGLVAVGVVCMVTNNDKELTRHDVLKAWRYLLLFVNPVSLAFLAFLFPRLVVVALVFVIYHNRSKAAEAICAIGRFFKEFYRRVHSNLRLLCMVDAAIGAAVGCYFRNPLAGAVVGGLWGLVNYEIVAKRILKTVRV